MKKTSVKLTALVLALALTACGKDAATKETESAAATKAAERTVTGTLLRDSKEETAYLEVSDTEIELWDTAADGALLGTAKYPQALSGAEAALQSCDWTDLDEDGNSELTAEHYPRLPFVYTVTSRLSTDFHWFATEEEDGKRKVGGRHWEEVLPPRHYLQLPEEKISARLREKVRELTEGISSRYGKAMVLRDYLRDNFTYEQFSKPVPEGREGADYFVFELKEGHCEYFASTLAVMARLAGLPARVATGFSPGDYNTLLNLFEVYERHAHAWTQIFVPEYGWLTVDATPPGAVQSRTTPLGIGQLRDPFGDEWRVTPPELT